MKEPEVKKADITILERNLGGRPKGAVSPLAVYTKSLKLYIAQKIEKNKAPLIDAMINEAKNGNVMAFVALMDRAHGKPAQQFDGKDSDGNPIVFLPFQLLDKYGVNVSKYDVVDGNNDVKVLKNGSI